MSMADARRVMALEAVVAGLEERILQLEATVRDLVAASGPPPEPERRPYGAERAA